MNQKYFAVDTKRIVVEEIPTLFMRPEGVENRLGILFYHGWSSTKEQNAFRGAALATSGATVIIPDAIHHGERGAFSEYQKPETTAQYFFQTIEQSRKEFSIWKKHLQEQGIDRIMVMGHSMGGFTASTIYCDDEDLLGLVNLNGLFDFRVMEQMASGGLKDLYIPFEQNPADEIEKLKNRPILMLAGEDDALIPYTEQQKFYERLQEMNDDKDLVRFISYEYLGHFVTTNMMEESVSFMKCVGDLR